MSKLATWSVWTEFSLKGKKGKRPLENMTTCNVLQRAIQKSHPGRSLKDIEGHMTETMKHAPAKCRKQNKRIRQEDGDKSGEETTDDTILLF
ncbi:hypothetical protein SKAU_G00064370 [Synaphobranchus kaupii]|uniref:Uncharacterized protein n=1 Tax=Synaphobranchus kaupii TaxID=118154 RepID=A0A9Q1JB33_SYNKA|nr:hypothetical protein SKAU_G00064370 [Synaphobranchus kaupii]